MQQRQEAVYKALISNQRLNLCVIKNRVVRTTHFFIFGTILASIVIIKLLMYYTIERILFIILTLNQHIFFFLSHLLYHSHFIREKNVLLSR